MEPIEVRVTRLEAEADIRRLQHEYGYRSAEGDWAAVAELFTPDGELELGAQGRHLGRAAIVEYLASTFGGPYGPEALHAHLQVMPVITLSPGGGRARGTWRELGFGGGDGVDAYWVEGPMDVDYVLTAEGWRIERLRWYRTLHVPFDTGWQETPDSPPVAGAPPSAPSSDATPRWPDLAETVPFHFRTAREWPDEPVATAETASHEGPRAFAERTERLAAVHRIERLQAKQGYYFDKGFWAEVTALFAATGEIVLPSGRRITGRAAIAAWLRGFGAAGPQHGRLLDTVLVQPIVRLAADGTRATGRWRAFLQWAEWGVSHEIGLLDLDIDYRLEDDQWRVGRLRVTRTAFTSYDEGWSRDLRTTSRLSSGPDTSAPATADGASPRADALPADIGAGPGFNEDGLRSGASPDALLDELEAVRDIERTQFIYGYCLAVFDWERLTSLFAEDGSIEIAWRGVYTGRASVRRSLELYGGAAAWGVLHNHMQFQPVIHADTVRGSATIRARAFSMMAEFGSSARWMGGLYENEYVREAGVWRIRRGHLINTYFSPYRTGWKHLPPREAPGISADNPPDAPPTDLFRMYPEPYHLPFSYPPPGAPARRNGSTPRVR